MILAAGDVTTVGRSSINAVIEITGSLRPIEDVAIRARVEGLVEEVLVREGQAVKEGQLLAKFEDVSQASNVASAEASLAAAQSELTTARWELEQSEELFKVGAVPERDLKAAQQAEVSAKARVSAAEAALRAFKLTSRDTRVIAPISGIISTRTVRSGEHVLKGATLFTMVRNTMLELAATVPERFASHVVVGQTVSLNSDGRSLSGKLSRVSPVIDESNRTVTIYVDITNPDGSLKGGSFATGSVITRTSTNTLVIPMSALRQSVDGSRTYVYRVNNNTIEIAEISTGIENDREQSIEVISGLAEGDQIITGNVGTLAEGMNAEIIGIDSAERR